MLIKKPPFLYQVMVFNSELSVVKVFCVRRAAFAHHCTGPGCCSIPI